MSWPALPDDAAAGLAAGAAFTLRAAANDPLVTATLTHENDAEAGLTPLLTVGPTPILAGAIDLQLNAIVEVDVRLTLSHLLQPMGGIDDAVRQIHTTVRTLLDAAAA
ncbi:hypothetical protein [Mycolicibacter minnesotensis]